MDYRDAIEIARKNPGTSVTRDEGGSFIVRRADGTPFEGQESATDEIGHLKQENEKLQKSHDNLFALLDQAKRDHQTELAAFEATIHQLQNSLDAVLAEQASAINHLKELEAKLAKVSHDEWERIKAAEEKERQDYARARKAERHIQTCACLGEVENCARCDGRGSYTTDGFGNPV